MIDQILIKIVQADYSIAIMAIVLNDHVSIKRDFSPELVEEQIARTDLTCQKWEVITKNDLPARVYRNAWCDAGLGKIGHDMAKARELHRDILRTARAPRLLALDVEMSKAYQDKAKQDQIEAQRQRLRDAPAHPFIDQAQTIEDLIHLNLDTLIH